MVFIYDVIGYMSTCFGLRKEAEFEEMRQVMRIRDIVIPFSFLRSFNVYPRKVGILESFYTCKYPDLAI